MSSSSDVVTLHRIRRRGDDNDNDVVSALKTLASEVGGKRVSDWNENLTVLVTFIPERQSATA